jgi:4-amino-4-deoxy-L-arabinose transferase-like glycosyltransferase
MQPGTFIHNSLSPRRVLGVAVLILLIAAALRMWGLPKVPPGPHYDEAANGILAAEIANGVKTPVFIPSYTGKEVLFFYMTAAAMKVLGVGLLALRLTSTLVG